MDPDVLTLLYTRVLSLGLGTILRTKKSIKAKSFGSFTMKNTGRNNHPK